MKELPRVYANPIDKSIDNNTTCSYGKLVSDTRERNERKVLDKIEKIFKRDNVLYSIDCIITYSDSNETCTVIGRTNNNLVTKNQRTIPIKEIYDIELAK